MNFGSTLLYILKRTNEGLCIRLITLVGLPLLYMLKYKDPNFVPLWDIPYGPWSDASVDFKLANLIV